MPRSSSDTQVERNEQQNGKGKEDGGEAGQDKKSEEQGPVGFFSPELKEIRKTVFKKWTLMSKASSGGHMEWCC